MSEFTVEISRPGEFGALTSATLELPATQAEYHDAMEKARTTDYKVTYSTELLDCKRGWLRPHIPKNANLLELNLLAIRMEKNIKDEIDVFEGMVKIETERNGGEPVPLPRLINMTFSIDNCHVAYGIHNDEALGKFLFDNDMLSDEDYKAAQIHPALNLFDPGRIHLFGKKHREAENGVFSSVGYVEIETVNEVYIPGEMAYFNNSGAPVVLEISKGHFNDPGYDNDMTFTVDLPEMRGKRLIDVLEKVEAASLEEIGYRCIDCLIPAAKELIDDAEDIEAVNRFAEALAKLQRRILPVRYKAMLEAVKPSDLESATRLVADADQYTLDDKMSGPEDYAREYLSRLEGGDERIDLSKLVNPYALGEQVMKLENAAWTSYGVLKRKDGGSIQARGQNPAGPEMKL